MQDCPRSLRKLAKQIEKFYFSNGQHLIVTTQEVMDGKGDHALSIVLYDPETKEQGPWLFDIRNYTSFYTGPDIHKSYFKPMVFPVNWNVNFDVDGAACQPRYFDREIIVYKFETITEQDILNATEYFIKHILGLLLFNFTFKKEW